MGWKVLKPDFVADLDSALGRCKTEAGRVLMAGYAELLADNGGAIPAKNGLDLRRFAGVLSNIVLCAVTKPDKCIWRLAGEHMQQRIGMNPVGRNYFDFVPEERRGIAIHAMHMVIDVPCGFRAEIEQTYSDGLVQLIEAAALPLASDETGVDGFIIFSDRHVETLDRYLPEAPRLKGANVVHRDLVDLGFGVDESFEDWVPA